MGRVRVGGGGGGALNSRSCVGESVMLVPLAHHCSAASADMRHSQSPPSTCGSMMP